jgi:hypothetical protein
VLRGVQPPNAPYGFPERGLAGGTLTPAAVLAMPWGTKELYDAQVAFLAPKSDVSRPADLELRDPRWVAIAEQ